MDIHDDPALLENWYYSIELAPELFSTGAQYRNIALTRTILSRVDVRGRRCLDLGTQEALVPALLSRRGAGAITATDILDKTPQIDLVRRALGFSFRYVPNQTIDGLPHSLLSEAPYDVVICSGLLYHVSDPYRWIALAGSMCAPEGILIFETAAVDDAAPILLYNARGAFFTGPTTYYFPSLRFIEEALRVIGAVPIDACRLKTNRKSGKDIFRVALAARMKRDDDDPYLQRVRMTHDTRPFKNSFPPTVPVGYAIERCGDLETMVLETPPLIVTPDQVRLRISDQI